MRRLFTSESVTEGHPDKICDNISDSVLDAILEQDPMARVACETAVTTGMVLVMGEITTNCYVDIPKIVRQTIREIGYDRAKFGFDCDTCAVITSIDEQSADIAMGVDEALEHKKKAMDDEIEAIGAGDQGMMFGFACNETPEYMPMPISLAHKLTQRLAFVRKQGILDYLRPDGKSQVTVEYEDGVPARLDTVVLSTQHTEDVVDPRTHNMSDKARKVLIEKVIRPVVMKECPRLWSQRIRFYINPTGRFVTGGPHGDTGLTGRKIIVDTYGGRGCHGGGAFSGKDPSKVDRSASYMARYIAKNIVAAGLATACEVQLAYAIGVAEPVSVLVDTEGTGRIDEATLSKLVRDIFPLKPRGIIDELKLLRPIYKETARHGHFGRSGPGFTWERTDKVAALRKAAAKYMK